MITDKTIKASLAKDGINLTDDECRVIRGLLISLAQIEYESFLQNETESPPCRAGNAPELGRNIESGENIAA